MTFLRDLSGWMFYTFTLVVLTNMSAKHLLSGNPLLGIHLGLMSVAIFFLALSHLDKTVTPFWFQVIVKSFFWLTISASAALAAFTLHMTGVL
jgi:hypothetical protein